MKLGYSSETVRDTLAAKIQEGLHEHVYLQRVVRRRLGGGGLLALPQGVRQLPEHVQGFFGGALVADTDHQLVRRLRSGQGSCKRWTVGNNQCETLRVHIYF